jgi:hypothetical protein
MSVLRDPPILEVLREVVVWRVCNTKYIESVLIVVTQSPPQRLQAIDNLVSVFDCRDGYCPLTDDPVYCNSRRALVDLSPDTLKFIYDWLNLVPVNIAEVPVSAWFVITIVLPGQAT